MEIMRNSEAREKTNAKLLKDMMQKVNLGGIVVTVKALKKTNQGHLLVEVMGGKEKATLKYAITSNTDSRVVKARREEVVQIADIDAVTDEEKIGKGLCRRWVRRSSKSCPSYLWGMVIGRRLCSGGETLRWYVR